MRQCNYASKHHGDGNHYAGPKPIRNHRPGAGASGKLASAIAAPASAFTNELPEISSGYAPAMTVYVMLFGGVLAGVPLAGAAGCGAYFEAHLACSCLA